MKLKFFIVLMFCTGLFSCKKEFLEEKPSKSLLVPTTFADMQALLDNYRIMNFQAPGLTMLATDEVILGDATWSALSTAPQRNSYVWAADLAEGATIFEWNNPYMAIFYANVVLDGLDNMSDADKDSPEWKKLRGAALFFRGSGFFYLSQLFCEQYDDKANANLGIPLPLHPDVNRRYGRGTLQETFDRILMDLNEAYTLLPEKEVSKIRPTSLATAAMLARINLTMGNYNEAGELANSCISKYDGLIDYNVLNPSSFNPFEETLPNGNAEVLLYMASVSYAFQGASTTTVDPNLYALYEEIDTRKKIFFTTNTAGLINSRNYGGISLPEVYLISAECYARNNALSESMVMLHRLREKRYIKNSIAQQTVLSRDEALRLIFIERRKELSCNSRSMRWYDLKRLNKEQLYETTLKRYVNGQVHELLPNDRRYVYPIPDQEIIRHQHVQNQR
ncbi:RagB/SusD family nutrient uptake outer membrane protein [Pedobacter insulae]|uniref:SusD family protein n=1 Tax=Pedobacter insulae TaxID=414048 RepID=A0A1I2WV23_9SPHI|nr:RagB/SusD family nutrient uptake outer membrane protein [Pedobacter insulae]SFH05158.1 SusD family protein [Pedobacter insulae]